MRLIIGVRRWALIVGAFMVLAAFVGSWIAAPSAPDAPEPCRDWAGVYSETGVAHSCPASARIVTAPFVDRGVTYFEVRCLCPRLSDGGAP